MSRVRARARLLRLVTSGQTSSIRYEADVLGVRARLSSNNEQTHSAYVCLCGKTVVDPLAVQELVSCQIFTTSWSKFLVADVASVRDTYSRSCSHTLPLRCHQEDKSCEFCHGLTEPVCDGEPWCP